MTDYKKIIIIYDTIRKSNWLLISFPEFSINTMYSVGQCKRTV